FFPTRRSSDLFIAILLIWSVLLKRSMAEGMIIGFLVTTLFGGSQMLQYLYVGIQSSASDVIVYAAVGFVFMAYLISEVGIMQRILDFLNSFLGRLRGGPAYVDTVGSAVMGALAGSNAGNAAATGAVTAPWMMDHGFSPKRAGTIVAGNSSMGAALPPSNSMVIMLGFAAGTVSHGSVYLALLITGLYQLLYRFVLVGYFAKKDGIRKTDPAELTPIRTSWKYGWKPSLVYLGAVIPIVLTIGPVAAFFENHMKLGDSLENMSIMIWIPTLIVLLACIVGFKALPKNIKSVHKFVSKSMPRASEIGVLLFFAIAAANVFVELGIGDDVESLLEGVEVLSWGMVIIVTIVLVAAAGPLTGAPAVAALGQVSMLTLIAAGIHPVLAIVIVLMATSTEGQSPPASAPAFISAGLVQVNPPSLFKPLVIFYLLPVLLMTILVGTGILPVPLGGN